MMNFTIARVCLVSGILTCALGCGRSGTPAGAPPAVGPGQVAPVGSPAAQPWIVLSDFQVERKGPVSKVSVKYRFAEGQPAPGMKYHWIIEEQHGVSNSVSFIDEAVDLQAGGGTLTTEARIGTGPGQVATVIAVGPRSTSTGVPEPEHVSGLLYEGQTESSVSRQTPEQEATPATFAKTVVLSNVRRETSDARAMIAIDYKVEKLPEAGRFYLNFNGAEGGTVSYDVTEQMKSGAQSGTFRHESPETEEIVAPLDINLVAEPFGSGGGPPTDTSEISNMLQLE